MSKMRTCKRKQTPRIQLKIFILRRTKMGKVWNQIVKVKPVYWMGLDLDLSSSKFSTRCFPKVSDLHRQQQPYNGLWVKSRMKWRRAVVPAAAALPMACSVDRPLLPSRLRPPPLPAAEPKPSDEDDEDDMDWLSIFCSTRPNSTSTSL